MSDTNKRLLQLPAITEIDSEAYLYVAKPNFSRRIQLSALADYVAGFVAGDIEAHIAQEVDVHGATAQLNDEGGGVFAPRIVQNDADGQFEVGIPTADNHAATKKYVDDEVTALDSSLGTAAVEDSATLLDRANHTGTQPLSTISDAGTAAAADITTSATDTTSGRVIRTNDLTARGVPATAGGELPSQFDSPTIIIKDSLRASVEAASGGRATVMYDDLDQPSYMVRVPAFNREDIHSDFGSGLHPAFVVNGTNKSEIWIGMHQARVHNGRALSIPGLVPTGSISWDNASAACTNKGSGWHLMTNWEWAAVSLWVLKQVADGVLPSQPRGNTDYGRSHEETQETGTLVDGALGSSGTRTLTGSGPDSWRHSLSAFGISDMIGNIWEWVGGLKLVDGSIYLPVDNHYGQADAAWGDSGKNIAAGSDTTWRTATGILASGTYNADYDDALMRSALILPANVSNTANGSYWTELSGERFPLRGGRWVNGPSAGIGTLDLLSERSRSLSTFGCRPVFIA